MRSILWYCPEFYPRNSGYANAFLLAIRATLSQGQADSIKVITNEPLNGYDELSIVGLEITRIPRNNFPRLGATFTEIMTAHNFSTQLRDQKYSAAIVETFDKSVFLSMLPRRLFRKIGVRVHATSETEYNFFSRTIRHRFNRFMIKRFIRPKLKWVLSTNSYHIGFIKDHFFSSNILDIANCNFLMLRTPAPMHETDTSLPELGKRTLVMLGRMDKLGVNQKGFYDLALALRLVNKQEKMNLKVLIIGDGPEKLRLERAFRGCGDIEFCGSLTNEETIKVLQSSDGVVLPSRYEGLSMFALEAIASGCVAVFASAGALTDLVDGNGYLFEPQNIDDLKEKIVNFMHLDSTSLEKMQCRSTEIGRTKFSEVRVAAELDFFVNCVAASDFDELEHPILPNKANLQ